MTGLETQLVLARLVVLAALYAFLAGVGWLAWRDMRRSRRAVQAVSEIVGPRLIVLDGAASDRPPGTAFRLDSVSTIGRDIDNHVVLTDPTVSGRHAVVNLRDDAWWLEDLRSTNGTFVNGDRLDAESPAILRSGDVIQTGAVRMRLVVPEL